MNSGMVIVTRLFNSWAALYTPYLYHFVHLLERHDRLDDGRFGVITGTDKHPSKMVIASKPHHADNIVCHLRWGINLCCRCN